MESTKVSQDCVRGTKRSWKWRIIRIIILVLLLLFLYWNNNALSVTQYLYQNPEVPQGFEGYRIVHLSDLHNKVFGGADEPLLEQIAALEGMLAKAEQKRLQLMQQIENQQMELNNEMSEEEPVPVMPDLAIFFEIGKADLNEKAMINIGYLADMLKQFPEKRYVLFASADKETGTPEFNMELSKKRGDAVYKVMVERFGVSPDQLRIEAVGSTQQKSNGAPLNRVVVIEDQE